MFVVLASDQHSSVSMCESVAKVCEVGLSLLPLQLTEAAGRAGEEGIEEPLFRDTRADVIGVLECVCGSPRGAQIAQEQYGPQMNGWRCRCWSAQHRRQAWPQ